ncbi:MAG: hypothetical protein GY869_27650 [Planctomycetes bacterium]|nr:hypothetical protein [Planctomycetota bacterium]
MMMASPAMAFNATEHVIQAPNAVGDLLIYPHYIAYSGGWETKLTVTNTDDERSVVAKLVVRSGGYSEELLDFLIYLSPGDVWTGKIYYNTTDGASMYSEDDSCQSGPSVWASATNPLDQPLADVCSNDPYGNEIGYVEIVEVFSSTAPTYVCTLGTVDLGPSSDTVVEKLCIWEAYHNDFATAGVNDSPFNVLTGHYEISLAEVFLAGDLATVLRDYDIIVQQTIQTETRLGVGANNSLCEVEASLSKDPMNLPFINDGGVAIHWISFPTKLSVVDSSCAYTTDCDSPSDTLATHVFTTEGSIDYTVVFSPKYWDLSENTPGSTTTVFSPYTSPPDDNLPFEVNLNFTQSPFVSSNYEEGWFRYDFADTISTTCTAADTTSAVVYGGVPGLGLVWMFTPNGLAIIPASHDNAAVYVETVLMPYYQYYNGAFSGGGTGEFSVL